MDANPFAPAADARSNVLAAIALLGIVHKWAIALCISVLGWPLRAMASNLRAIIWSVPLPFQPGPTSGAGGQLGCFSLFVQSLFFV